MSLLILVLGSPAAAQEDPYPLSLPLRTIEKDLALPDYRTVVDAMIPTDLEAEWQRIGTPDNYRLFEKAHGGAEKVAADPKLKAAYERRQRIATDFLALLRAAYEKKKRKAPFDDAAALVKVLESADRKGTSKAAPEIPVRALLPAPESEKQWPAFRGATGRGIVSDPRLPLKWTVLWKAKLPGRGNSSPVVWGDRLFTTSEGPTPEGKKGPARLLVAYDRRDGKPLWQHATEHASALEGLYAKNTFASSTPVTDGERVIAFLGNGGLLACDLDGKRLWHRDLGAFPTVHGPGSTPVLYKDLVILVQDQTSPASFFAAFDKRTGEPRWKRERKKAMCWSSPVLLRVGERDELVFNGSLEVISYDPATGEEIWKVSGSSKEAIPMIAAGGGLLFSTSGRNGPTIAIRPGGRGEITETHVVWRHERGGPHVPSPAWHDGRLYLVADTGILTCVEAATGALIYQERLPGWYSMSPLLAGDVLLLVNEKGKALVLRTGPRFEIVAENDLGEPVLATPAVLDGRIYFRTAENLICVGEK
jgi:outer membrane protein assembly factor BamB